MLMIIDLPVVDVDVDANGQTRNASAGVEAWETKKRRISSRQRVYMQIISLVGESWWYI